jgi:hypothetical protein
MTLLPTTDGFVVVVPVLHPVESRIAAAIDTKSNDPRRGANKLARGDAEARIMSGSFSDEGEDGCTKWIAGDSV